MNLVLSRALHDLKRHILAGIVTAGPLFITWLVFTFVLGVLANVGLPIVKLIAAPFPGTLLSESWFQYIFSVVLTVTVFYLVGRLTAEVVGRQTIALFEASLERLPVVNKIYGSVRQAIETLMNKNQSGQRVVMIEFPLAGQKAIGFLTHVIADATSGMPIGAVLVPQAINPSSSFLQFVPMDAITETDLTMEQAMSMLLTGGAVCPDLIRYSAPTSPAINPDGSLVPVSIAMEDESAQLTPVPDRAF